MTITRIAALVTGAAGLALGATSLAGPAVPDQHWGTRGAVVNLLGLVLFAAMAVAVELLRAPLVLTGPGRAGVRVAQAGLALMCIESVASQVHGGNILGAVFMLGLLAALVGLALVGVDGVRRRRWLGPLPLLALLVGVGAGERGGFLVVGLVWLALAVATREHDAVPALARQDGRHG